MGRSDLERLSKEELIELVLRLQRPEKTSRTSSKPPSTDRKERREQAKPGGTKPGHEGHSRTLSADPDEVVAHRPGQCPCCGGALAADLPAEIVSLSEQIELPEVAPLVTQHQRLAMRCPSCGTRVVAAVPEAARAAPFGPRLHAVATYLKTFQALSYERLQAALADLSGLTLSQGGLMNLLRRAQKHFRAGREAAVSALHRAAVVASDETGVRIEGSTSYHWVFRSDTAVVHHAAPTRAAAVVHAMMDGHRPSVWISDHYTTQQGHGERHQTCLAHLARDVAYAVEVSDDPVPLRLQLWLGSVFSLAERVSDLAAATLAAKRRALERRLSAILSALSTPGASWFFRTSCGAGAVAGGCVISPGLTSESAMPRRLLPLVPPQLSVVGIEPTPDHLVIHVRLRPRPTCCPGCRGLDCRPHGSYHRTSADLPWQGRSVSLRLRVRRFRCTNPACPRRTFSEQGGDIVQPHARRSVRLHDLQRHLGLALGGEPAARLAQRLAMPVSGDTLLRLVRAGALPTHPEPRVVGVDEWAWRRGRSYGTVFVDLERHTVLDLLPDRATESVAAWLHGHPDIAVVARDRAEVFAEGTRVGAPQARQVLDRFHLLRNLSAALRAIAVDHHAAIRAAGRALLDQEVEAARTRSRAARTPTASEIRKRATHAPRQARHAELKRLAEGGASVSGMARALGLDRKTVRVWLARDAPPSWRRRRVVPTILDPYRADLEARWQAGCHNAAELARALIRAGADVRPRVVRDWAMKRRREAMDVLDAVPGSPSTPRWRPPSAERTARLLQADPSTLGEIDRRFVEGLRAEAPALVESAVLAIRFADLVRRRSCESVEAWLAAASATPLASSAAGLQHDVEALRGTTTTPWSTGPVEGQIGRLKLLKRMMFGRAGFALLRQRVLARF